MSVLKIKFKTIRDQFMPRQWKKHKFSDFLCQSKIMTSLLYWNLILSKRSHIQQSLYFFTRTYFLETLESKKFIVWQINSRRTVWSSKFYQREIHLEKKTISTQKLYLKKLRYYREYPHEGNRGKSFKDPQFLYFPSFFNLSFSKTIFSVSNLI